MTIDAASSRAHEDALSAELQKLNLGNWCFLDSTGVEMLVQTELAEQQWSALAGFMREHGITALDVSYQEMVDLNFLAHFPWLTAFTFEGPVESVDGLNYLSEDLRSLGFGPTRKFSLRFLERFPNLTSFGVGRPVKDIETISTLHNLRWVGLGGALRLKDVDVLGGLPNLMIVSLESGTCPNLSALSSLPALQMIDISSMRTAQDSDLAPIADCTTLKHLELYALPQITALPDLSRLINLHGAYLQTMRSLSSLAGLAAAPNLTYLRVEDDTVNPDIFADLKGHPTLKEVTVISTKDRREAIQRVLPNPPYPSSGEYGTQYRAAIYAQRQG
ncbi:hypothetical protein [Mycolicibacterium cosmeticum]|uniref:hypothetical protein n=1 Tax=Mycolicibacterium cosmeticum TaxID=258533 RepID=UPI003204F43F